MSRGVGRAGHAVLVVMMTAGWAGLLAGAQADKWSEATAAFEQQDRERAPRAGGIVFVGSSSIRLWNLDASFPDLPVVNRGFGGSQIVDSVNHLELLVLRHRPRTVVFYAGDNDIAAGKSPETVAADFRTFVAGIHARLPQTRIAFIGVKPSVQRWALVAQVRAANALVRDYCDTDDRLGFVDVDRPMIGWDGKPRPELLVDDGLHLSPAGYELWTTLVRPFLHQQDGASAPPCCGERP